MIPFDMSEFHWKSLGKGKLLELPGYYILWDTDPHEGECLPYKTYRGEFLELPGYYILRDTDPHEGECLPYKTYRGEFHPHIFMGELLGEWKTLEEALNAAHEAAIEKIAELTRKLLLQQKAASALTSDAIEYMDYSHRWAETWEHRLPHE